MEYINSNWYIKENVLSRSLKCFFINIHVCFSDNKLSFILDIIDKDLNHLTLFFSSLEDAISFTNSIENYNSFGEITDKYKDISNKRLIKK